MKNITLFITFFLFNISISAQPGFFVESTAPQNNSTNVSLFTTVSIQFNKEIDTTKYFMMFDNYFTNIATIHDVIYSSDKRSVNIIAELEGGKDYYFLIFNSESADGDQLNTPYLLEFTTGAEFGGYSVSGVVTSDVPGLALTKTLVALSTTSLEEGEPFLERAGFTDSEGNFVIAHVADGDYYPLATKDINGNNRVDPDNGDALALGSPIIVSGGNINNVLLNLVVFDPISLAEAVAEMYNYYPSAMPQDAALKSVRTYQADTSGNASYWDFEFTSSSMQSAYQVTVEMFATRMETSDSNHYNWLKSLNPINNLEAAADPQVFVQNVENSGGAEFRSGDYPDEARVNFSLRLGDLSQSEYSNLITDPTQLYWGAEYRVEIETGPDERETLDYKLFLGDYTTGSVLVVSGVEQNNNLLPIEFDLEQNYPNPFNPATTIRYQIPDNSVRTSVDQSHLYLNDLSSGRHMSLQPIHVKLSVYDILGNEITTLVNKQQSPGNYKIEFKGAGFASGVYLYRLTAGEHSLTRKMVILR